MLEAPTAPHAGAAQGELPEAASNPSAGRLTREQVVDRIIQINPTATTAFLASFDQQTLRHYLDRLDVLVGQRGRHAVWARAEGDQAVYAPRPV